MKRRRDDAVAMDLEHLMHRTRELQALYTVVCPEGVMLEGARKHLWQAMVFATAAIRKGEDAHADQS